MSRDLIDRYERGAEVLAYAVQDLTPTQATARPGPGAWSIAQLVAHLLDADLVYADRIKRLIAEDDPVLQAFDENAWIERLDSQSMQVGAAVDLFATNRRWVARLLRRCGDAEFARAGRHTQAGVQTLAQVVTTITHHVDHHLAFLYAKRGNLGVAIYPRYTRGE